MRAVVAALMAAGLLVVIAAPAAASPSTWTCSFVGAHPDDEAFGLAVYGAWGEELGRRAPASSRSRAARAAATRRARRRGRRSGCCARRRSGARSPGPASRTSSTSTRSTSTTPSPRRSRARCGRTRSTLERVVRVVRATRPEVIVTMDPSPTPGNHGHHQLAARLAVEAYAAAADPSAFRVADHARRGSRPWRVKRLFTDGAAGEYGDETGPGVRASFTPAERTDETFGLWAGARARNGTTWAQIARRGAARVRLAGLGRASRTRPRTRAGSAATASRRSPRACPTARAARTATRCCEGALVRAPGGLPLGTELRVAPASLRRRAGRDASR